MRITKYPKGIAVALEENSYQQIKKITSEKGISMSAWVRELIDEKLQSLSFEDNSIESDQETDEDKQGSYDSPSLISEDFNLRYFDLE